MGARAVIEPDLAEWDYGDYEGLRSADIHRERPGWSLYRDGAPNGETPDAVYARADRLVTRLLSLSGTVALFSHRHFGAVLATRWIGLAVIEGRRFPLEPCSVSRLGFAASHPSVKVIDLWNAGPGSP